MTFVLLVAGIDLSVGANMYVSLHRRWRSISRAGPPFGFLVAGHAGPGRSAPSTPSSSPACACRPSSPRWPRCLSAAGSRSISPARRWSPSARRSCTSAAPACSASLPRSGSSSSSSLLAWVDAPLTTFGRQVYAVGADPDAAAKAGIDVPRILFAVYCICGVCRRHRRAGLGEPGRPPPPRPSASRRNSRSSPPRSSAAPACSAAGAAWSARCSARC